jgi:hypothetical protein
VDGAKDMRVADFFLRDGVLFRRASQAPREGSDGAPTQPDQLVVPASNRSLLIEYKHEGEHAGHPGAKRTFEKLRLRYWWPRLRKDVEDYVTACEACRRIKPTRHRLRTGSSATLSVVHRPFERLSFDVVTISEQSLFPHMLVVLDHATRYVVTIPLPDKAHDTIA